MTDPFHSRLRIRSDYLTAIAVTLAPVAYFLPAILNGVVLCPDDGLIQNVPYRVAAAQIIRSGSLPLWNPYIFGGMPLLASGQVGILYPLNWFYLAFAAQTATNLMVVSSYMVAALGAFLYARRIGTTIAGAAVCSLVWQCSGALIGQISHINIVHTAAILPWLLWSVEAHANRSGYRNGVLLSIFVAIQFFAGHPQTFVYSLILVTVYVVVMAMMNVEHRRRYFSTLAFISIGFLLAAIQIVPTLELLRNSERASASYEFFTSFSMPRRFVMTLLAPYLMGGGDGRLFRAPYLGPPYYQEMVGYVGVLAIALAILALLIKPDQRTKFWASVVLVCFLLAFGGYAPLGFYRIIYHVPLLNLFRVPARHLMEIDFALAVLAGLGVTAISKSQDRSLVLKRVAIVGLSICALTLIMVTWLRPTAFRLGREAPLTLIHAPELFLPLVFALLSLVALWCFAGGKRGANVLLFTVLVVDLFAWGHFTGWYTASPRRSDEYWKTPETIAELAKLAPSDTSTYRILTVPHTFDPARPPVPPSVSHSSDWVLWTQPDVYMMHGIQNAAGYDGFGLRRYSELAGRMKVWGELTDPDLSLRSGSREVDLVNVRYLISMREQSLRPEFRSSTSHLFSSPAVQYGEFRFAAEDLGLPNLGKNKRLRFTVPPTTSDHIAITTSLSWSENIPDGTTVALLRVRSVDGQQFDFPLRAGTDTAEWSHDRPDILAHIKHRRAPIASSYEVKDTAGTYEAHTFVTAFALPPNTKVESGEFVLQPVANSPELTLGVYRVSLVNAGTSYPLRRDWVSVEDLTASALNTDTDNHRWKLVTRTNQVEIYENLRALPRAWMASDVRVVDPTVMLHVIRSGKFADGSEWNTERTALIESPLAEQVQPGEGKAQILRYEPNRIDVNTNSNSPAVLVLSENHYSGWRTYVDGKGVETLRVDYNLRGVPLSAGTHRVEFLYRPKSVLIGLVLSLFGAAVLGVAPLARRRMKLSNG